MSINISSKFIDYLIEIGFIDFDSSKQLNKIYQDILSKQNNIEFKTAMCASLMYYIQNMDENQQKFLSYNLIIKYFNKILKDKIKKLRSLFNILIGNQKLLLLKILNQWSKKNINIKNNKLHLIETKGKNNTLRLFKSSSNCNYFHKMKQKNIPLEASWIKKENEELQECTFSPIINKNGRVNSIPNNNSSVFDRLYEYNKKKIIKQKINILDSEETEFTFRKNQETIKNKKNNLKVKKKKFVNHKEKKIHNLSDDFTKEYAYDPNLINGNKISEMKNFQFLNLFEELSKRSSLKNNLKQKYNLNFSLNDINNFNNEYDISLNLDNNKESNHKNNNYENINQIYMQLKKKSFHNHNNICNIQTNNDIKNEYLDTIEMKLKNKLSNLEDENKNSIHLKKYSQLEKEEITKRIIDRLYSNSNSSTREKNKFNNIGN
jgi:hypothetical protein